MKQLVHVLVLFLVGAGGSFGFLYLSNRGRPRPSTTAAGLCVEHEVPEKECPWCDPGLIEEKGECGGHGVPEALCSRCNAILIPGFKAIGDWCGGHDVPESQCVLCHPSLAAPVAEIAADVTVERGLRSELEPRVQCETESLSVRFLSAQIAEDAGLGYATVSKREVPFALTCTAEVEYDQNQYAHVGPRAPGVLREVSADLGQRVSEGEALAVVLSTELGGAKTALLQARALAELWARNDARERRLLAQGVAIERDVLQAETERVKAEVEVSGAEQRLRNLGLSAAEIAYVGSTGDTTSALSVTAPFAGTVVAREAVVGEVVDTAHALFAIADTSTMWVMLDVQEADLRRVRVGQPVVFSVTSLPGETFGGRVTWVAAELNRRTRVLRVRAEVENPEGILRAGMVGEAVVHVRERAPRVVVPKEAVQWEGCCNVVFVRRSAQEFVPRKVRLGEEAGRYWVVEEGVEEGETVVTTGSFLLKTEILKGSIGAGCCEPGE